ncbi:hypothetical protein Gasu2_36930 [Galdieria sulphuraria]|uniref:Uncharacterized protein n=1 Tax=Galdieria sulphuraria TaxID=130081 RepID=M2XS92_GALSU|nr:uncharacterized protein Gasu_60600 [Galdieria sulphuraria]EME26284.1 hypothetical protein Gasu_60600 [Galdieria sulphuraria]GJD09439.1 hypothetical protein Gasu2_36930 [Galdieria sulphuraria]|eukprot:XP_005702804.1 hypothetical protein Gasu_60600 [Galdieria sulphuraria]
MYDRLKVVPDDLIQINKDRKVKRLEQNDILSKAVQQPGDVFCCFLNIQLIVNSERAILGNITSVECIELCRLLAGHLVWLEEELCDFRLEAILGALLCSSYCEWTAWEREKEQFTQQWNALENLSSLDTWKWALGIRERVETMLQRVKLLTSIFTTLLSANATHFSNFMVVQDDKEWEKLLNEKQDIVGYTLEAALQKTCLVENQLARWKDKLDSLVDLYSIGNAAFDARMWSLDLLATILSVCFAIYGMFSQFFGYYVQLPIYNMGNSSQYYFYGIAGGITIALSITIYFSSRWFLRAFYHVFSYDSPFQK